MSKKEAIIERFCKIFGCVEESIKESVEKHKSSVDKVVIHNRTRSVAIINYKKIENTIVDEWKEYELIRNYKRKNGEFTVLLWGKYFHRLFLIMEIINKFFKGDETFTIRQIGRDEDDIALLSFMIDNEWAICLSNNISGEFELTDNGINFGINFIALNWVGEDEELLETERKFGKWINGTAFVDMMFHNSQYKKIVYKKHKIFNEIINDNIGDMMLI